MLLLCAFLSVATDSFLSVRNFLNILDQITVLGILAVGMTFVDNSRLSLGPESELSLEEYAYSRPGRRDSFDARLRRGSLTATSGQIARSRPLAMRVLLPTTVLGVKGTKLAARTEGAK